MFCFDFGPKIKIISTNFVPVEFPHIDFNFIPYKYKMTLVTENTVHTLGLSRELAALMFYFFLLIET